MFKSVRLVPFFYRAKLLWWNVPVGGLFGGLWQHSPAFLSMQCTTLYVLFPSSRAKLLWWNVRVGGLYGGLWQHSPAALKHSYRSPLLSNPPGTDGQWAPTQSIGKNVERLDWWKAMLNGIPKKIYLYRDIAAGVLSFWFPLPSYDPILPPPLTHSMYTCIQYSYSRREG